MSEILCEKKVPLKVKEKFVWQYHETGNNVRIWESDCVCVFRLDRIRNENKNLWVTWPEKYIAII